MLFGYTSTAGFVSKVLGKHCGRMLCAVSSYLFSKLPYMKPSLETATLEKRTQF